MDFYLVYDLANNKFEGKRVGLISMKINSGNYNGAVVFRYNNDGIYLKTMTLLKLFRPAFNDTM